MTIPTLLLTPRRAALLTGHDNELDVLVRVQAPEAPAGTPPLHALHLALVMDRSGSMAGEPLEQAKRCAEFMLDGLHDPDRLSVVVFDNQVSTLAPAAPLNDKAKVRRAIRAITSGGNTDLHRGWLQGAETLAPHTRTDVLSRVVLLSDANANSGLTDGPQIAGQCAELARTGITTSTYGLGRAFNEELMIDMARHGKGHSYYGSTASDLMDPFREELALLNATCARSVRLDLAATAGVSATLLNDYVVAGESAATPDSWWLPDLAYAGEAWAVLRLRISRQRVDVAAAEPLLGVTVHYVGLDGEPRAIAGALRTLPTLPVAVFQAIAEDELVARRAGELEAARLQQEAREHAQRHEWTQVDAVLQRASRVAEHNPWVRESICELRVLAERRDDTMFAKEAAFQSHRLQTRLAGHDEQAGSHKVSRVASYLRRKTNQGKGDEQPKA
jgi:Ca-activated chloride channel family protein